MRHYSGFMVLALRLLSKLKQFGIFLLSKIFTAAVGRRGDLWIFASFVSNPQFSDNSKYLYLHVAHAHPEIRAIWITDSPRVHRLLEEEGYEVEMRRSLRARYHALRAGVVVLDSGLGAVPMEYAAGAIRVQLTHGIPLKGPRRWKDRTAPEERSDGGLVQGFIEALSRRIYSVDYLCVPSEEAARQVARWVASSAYMGHFERSFPSSTLLITGYPRTDGFYRHIPEADLGNPPELHDCLEHARGYDVVIGYFPTFRDDRQSIEPFDVNHLTSFLEERNAILLVKPHREMEVGLNGAEASDHILTLPPDADSATFLQRIDILITDYSSIYFDYLHTGNPILLYAFDREEYAQSRGLLPNYDEVTAAGQHVHNFQELLDALELLCENKLTNPLAEQADRLNKRFFLHRDGLAGARIVSALTGAEAWKDLRQVPADEVMRNL